ncbi:MAG TPA: type II toxin-antitoxin system prevent-host-death family antitoxin [Rhodospirillaceae bacterium]|nr:type II toxin-antitoxin system prevent-host-death family antitoxin [Rhodospirillaceae bacterium]
MQISVCEAKGHLLDLVRRAEAGEEIILTRHGAAVVRLVPTRPTCLQKRALLQALFGVGRDSGLSAARSQDFLYGEAGLPH